VDAHQATWAQVSEPAPRVAVVVPCFNSGKFLVEAIESAAPEADELVIVDDESTDTGTLGLLGELERKGYQVIRRRNGGPAAARMTGVAATTSPYIFPLDSDDRLESGALLELADALDANPSAGAAWGDLRTFGLTDYRIPSVPALDPWFVTYANLLPLASLYRRDALMAVGGWQLPGIFEDWDTWMALAERRFTGIYIPRVVYCYRRQRESLMSTSIGRYGDVYAVLRQRHQKLFSERNANRSVSPAPTSLKLLVPIAARIPLLQPQRKFWLVQFLCHLLWNGGLRASSTLLALAVKARTRTSRPQ